MASILENVAAASKAWWYSLKLSDSEIGTSQDAMQALRNLGDASLPALRRGIRNDDYRVQLRSAVVLHWLGGRDGLPVLIDSLRYGQRSRIDSTNEITSCYLMIGAPDATKALIGVWHQLPNLSDNDPTAILICRIWRLLRDSSMLSCLCETSTQTPRLFVETISVFGTDAIVSLRVLAHDSDPGRRAMALRGLQQIPGYESARIIIPRLQDGDPEVRGLAASALEAVSGPVTSLNALLVAHRAGFSTAASVQMLVLYNPPDLYAVLAGLLTRYEPGSGTGTGAAEGKRDEGRGTATERGDGETGRRGEGREKCLQGDTVGAAREAAIAFSRCPWPNAQVTQLLCGLANRNVHSSIRVAVAQTIAERGRSGDDSDIQAYKTMWRQLTIVDRDARSAAAAALSRLGEPLGRAFEALLDSGRPQDSILQNLHAALVNSQDVGQAVSEAVQHVATWVNRISRVTAKRFSASDAVDMANDAILKDTRTPDLLRTMQANVLECLDRPGADEETVEALSMGVSTLRALARLESSAAQRADVEIRRTYTAVKWIDEDLRPGSGRGVREEAAVVLREAAGQALIDIYGIACFDTLMAGLSHGEDAVKVTSSLALGRLGDPRAVPLLQSISDTGSTEVVTAARAAITAIRRGNPEMMTLLRGSSSTEARPDTLLRPSIDLTLSPDLLLRPGQTGPSEQ